MPSTMSYSEALSRLEQIDPEAWEALDAYIKALQAKIDQASMQPLGL